MTKGIAGPVFLVPESREELNYRVKWRQPKYSPFRVRVQPIS